RRAGGGGRRCTGALRSGVVKAAVLAEAAEEELGRVGAVRGEIGDLRLLQRECRRQAMIFTRAEVLLNADARLTLPAIADEVLGVDGHRLNLGAGVQAATVLGHQRPRLTSRHSKTALECR